MPESSSNNHTATNHSKNELFSKLQIPPDTPFFVRLNGRRFQKIAQKLHAQKPFDKNFARCLVAAGKTLYQDSLNPTLVYVASDEVNALYAYTAPFNRRLEKINSVLAGTVSSAFSLCARKKYSISLTTSFDSRIIVTTRERLIDYLAWRQQDAWRNHNNAYGYWMLRKLGHKPTEAAEKLKGWKTEKLHEFLFQHGINLAKTPAWQRRGTLIYKQPYQKSLTDTRVTRRRTNENWQLPMLTSNKGKNLIQNILEWAKPHRILKKELSD